MNEPCTCRYSKTFPHRKAKCILRKSNKKNNVNADAIKVDSNQANDLGNKDESKKKTDNDNDFWVDVGAIATVAAAVGVGIVVGSAISNNCNINDQKMKTSTENLKQSEVTFKKSAYL